MCHEFALISKTLKGILCRKKNIKKWKKLDEKKRRVFTWKSLSPEYEVLLQ